MAQVTWSSSNSVSVVSGGNETSDAITIASDAYAAGVLVKVDHSGTPGSGDTVDIYILHSCGDPDADPDTSAEYETPEHVLPQTVDLYAVASSGGVGIVMLPVDVAATSCKVHVVNNGASSVTVSAEYSGKTLS